jgi:MFS family permease
MALLMDFSVLKRNRNYRLLYIGQFVSLWGTMLTSVALPYQLYHLTQSTLMVGLLSLAQLLPLVFTALLGGTLADRYPRRQLLIYSELGLIVSCCILALNTIMWQHVWILFLVSPFMSAITGLHRPSLSGMTQQIVEPKDFIAANSLYMMVYIIGAIAGPALGGLIIAGFGLFSLYLCDAASYIISLIALLLMTHIPHPVIDHLESTWTSLKKGLKFAGSRQELLGTYLVDFVAMIFGMPNALFPAIAQSLGGVKVLGLLYAAPAVGTLVISLFNGWCQRVKRHGVAIAVAASMWGLAIIAFGLAKNLWLALFFLAIAGALDTVSGIFRMTLWNNSIPNEYRGRLAGIEMIGYLSGPRLGDAEAGLVASVFGLTACIVSGGVLCIIGVAVCCYFMPKFWQYQSKDQPS